MQQDRFAHACAEFYWTADFFVNHSNMLRLHPRLSNGFFYLSCFKRKRQVVYATECGKKFVVRFTSIFFIIQRRPICAQNKCAKVFYIFTRQTSVGERGIRPTSFMNIKCAYYEYWTVIADIVADSTVPALTMKLSRADWQVDEPLVSRVPHHGARTMEQTTRVQALRRLPCAAALNALALRVFTLNPAHRLTYTMGFSFFWAKFETCSQPSVL